MGSGLEAVVLKHENKRRRPQTQTQGLWGRIKYLVSTGGSGTDSDHVKARTDDSRGIDTHGNGTRARRRSSSSVAEELVRLTPGRPTLATVSFNLLIVALVVLFIQTSIRCRHPEIKVNHITYLLLST
jgi:hypothetical protein